MKPSIEDKMEEVLSTTIKISSEWYTTIFNYLKYGTFPGPTTKNTQTRLWNLSNVLYQRSFDGILLICLKQSKIPITLEKYHVGSCGGNFGGRTLVQKLIHIRYYWRHIEQYFIAYVKKCQKCQ